jgi:hypothetical protein
LECRPCDPQCLTCTNSSNFCTNCA